MTKACSTDNLITLAAGTFAKIGEHVEVECNLCDYFDAKMTGTATKLPVGHFESVLIRPTTEVERGKMRIKARPRKSRVQEMAEAAWPDVDPARSTYASGAHAAIRAVCEYLRTRTPYSSSAVDVERHFLEPR